VIILTVKSYLAKHDSFTLAHYDFNLETQQILFAMLYKINSNYVKPFEMVNGKGEIAQLEYNLDFEEIKRLVGIDYAIENHQEKVKRIIKDLSEKTVVFDTKEYFAVDGLIIQPFIDNIKKTMTFNVSTRVKPLLNEVFKNFTKFGFKHLSLCESKYTLRLYEILITKTKKIPYDKKRSCTISIKEIRDILKLPKSLNYNQFKQRVLEKAKKEYIAPHLESESEKLDKRLFNSFEFFEISEKKTGRGRRPVSHIKFDFELLEETKNLMMSKHEKVKKELESEDWIFTELRILIDKNRERDSFFEKLEINYIYGVVIEIIEQIKADYEVFGNLNQMLIKNSLNSSFSRFTSKHRSADFISYLKNGFIWNCDNYLSKNKSLQEN